LEARMVYALIHAARISLATSIRNCIQLTTAKR